MASIGGLLVLLITGTEFSVSSEVGFLALFGVSVQTGVILLEYINQLRRRTAAKRIPAAHKADEEGNNGQSAAKQTGNNSGR